MSSSPDTELPAFQPEDAAVLHRYANAMTSSALRNWGGINVIERHTAGLQDIARRVEQELRDGSVARFSQSDADLLKKAGEQLVKFADGDLSSAGNAPSIQAEARLKQSAGKEILEVHRKIERRVAADVIPPAV